MSLIRTILVEDEPRSRNLLRGMIREFCPELQLIDEASDVESAIASILKNKPDLLFLDVNLFGSSGLTILETCKPKQVVFTTAYDQYALDAFKYDASDFLLKPVGPADLKAAVAKVKRRMLELDTMEASTASDTKRLALPNVQGLEIQDTGDILFIKAEGNYCFIHLKSGKKILVSKNIQHYEESLSTEMFYRLHKSYIVNMKLISQYIKGRGGHVIMADSTKIPVASRRKDGFLAQFHS